MFNFDVIPNRREDFSRKWDKALLEEKFGEIPDDFIPLWIADMDFAIAPVIQEAFMTIVQRGTFGYTYVYPEFAQSVCQWYAKRHNCVIDPTYVVLTNGTVSTIHSVLQAFCSSQRGVIMHSPVYDPFTIAASLNNIPVTVNPLVLRDNRYEIDFDLFERQLQQHRPAVYICCTPHNPSGRIWSKEELQHLYQLCQQYDVLVVADEVHSEHILQGEHTSMLEINSENIIVLSSANKAFNFAGLKTSYAIIPNEQCRQFFVQHLLKNGDIAPNTFGIAAVVAAYSYGEAWLEAVTAYIKENHEWVLSFMAEQLPDWIAMPIEASYLLWVDISRLPFTSVELMHLLAKETGVIIDEGSHYGPGGEHFIRINLGTSRSLLQDALNRIAAWYHAL